MAFFALATDMAWPRITSRQIHRESVALYGAMLLPLSPTLAGRACMAHVADAAQV
jgi:hypothetical protein